MGCQCHQIGGPFIAEDPECPEHGTVAQARDAERSIALHVARTALQYGTPHEIEEALAHTVRYLESL